ncbi:hypothetical protein MF621_004095 (plasmid) [Bacillus velezensis]|uniref:hypothetical protein n=1 Tax=Bacillus velezensis TaxID=492670 RepID=UPI0004A0ACA4|nr:hypothetical protein [Bacillus velezensis]KDN91289.1 hypothetical protein EF87_19580 [Bacillus amyloliquefaciens]URJ76388.1 hypothetical protein MF619_004133 [Bacillus velezensis]URJ80344.1 hypothetical protein MF621_004095 [Bacillus velezensis]
MSLNAMYRNVMIYSDEEDKAIIKLNEIASNLNEKVLVKMKNYIQTSNIVIEARRFSAHCRGYRYADVYIDNSLRNDEEAIGLIIMKLVIPHNDKDYDWRNHVFYFN